MNEKQEMTQYEDGEINLEAFIEGMRYAQEHQDDEEIKNLQKYWY